MRVFRSFRPSLPTFPPTAGGLAKVLRCSKAELYQCVAMCPQNALTIGLLLPLFLLALQASVASAEDQTGRSGLPLADPVLEIDVAFKANKARAWSEGQTQRLLLEGDVSVTIGRYAFAADRAYVQLDREPSFGREIHHVLVYLDQARAPRGKRAVAEAPRLLITASVTGRAELSVDLLNATSAANDPFVIAGARRIQRYLEAIAKPLSDVPDGPPLIGPDAIAHRDHWRDQLLRQSQQQRDADMADIGARLEPKALRPNLLAAAQPAAASLVDPLRSAAEPPTESILPSGVASFSFDTFVYQEISETEGAVVLIGNAAMMYEEADGKRTMTLKAQNAVLFVPASAKPTAGQQGIDASQVLGIYLEDNVVATDGTYTVRAPRVYYDLQLNKAVLIEAVFYTWDASRHIPIYLRAQKLRQESTTAWSAQRAVLTTSEFAEPHFSIGADELTFNAGPARDGTIRPSFNAQNVSINIGQTRVAVLPAVAGNAEDVPLNRASVGYSSNNGEQVATQWDLFTFLGRPKPDGVDMIGRVDVRGQHGPALGLDLDYELAYMYGAVQSYLLPDDHGDDEIGDRLDVEHDADERGQVLWRHRQDLREDWELSLELAYVSDETFLEEFFRDQAEEGKDYETLIYLKKQREDWAFTFVAGYDLQEFVEQTTTLQSRAYSVEKLPELGYYRIGTSLLDDRISYFTENRLGLVRIRPSTDSPGHRGFNAFQSMALFGITPTTDFEDVLSQPTDSRARLDSRHELQVPFQMGILDVVPYAAGRVTAYDSDFSEFSGETEEARLWGAVGTRVHTALSRPYDAVDSRLLDVYRLRHVIEPSVDLFVMGSNIDPEDLAVYDMDVEALHEGFGTRLGFRNTLQTQRGGPGQWRSVDWLMLNTDLVFRSDDTDVDTVIPRFFNYRPEYGLGGDHFYTDLMWMVSDTLAIVGDLTYSMESDRVVVWHMGGNIRHTPRLSSFVDYAMIEDIPSRLLNYGFRYRLTAKYFMAFRHALDLAGSKLRSIDVTLERRLPRWRLLFITSYDEIDDDTTVGVALVPEGIRSSRMLRPFDVVAIE